MFNKKMQYIIKTCASDNMQELQNLLNEMSMNGWELYTMNEVETDDGFKFNCIFMTEAKAENENVSSDIINISSFKSQMEKMLSPKLSPYENCLDIQSKIRTQQAKITKIKKELEKEAPASVGRKKLNDKISANLKELEELKQKLTQATSPDVMYSKLSEEKLSIHLSCELLDSVGTESDFASEALVAETVKVRLKLTEELGYVIPKILFTDDESLNPYEFCIKIRAQEVFKALIYPNYQMFYEDEIHFDKKPKNSITDTDQITGRDVIWIEKTKTKDFWEKGISGAEYIAKALEFISIKYVDDLLDYSEVEKYIDIVSEKNDFLVENLIPDYISMSDLRFILTSLIREEVSVKDITYLFEKMNDYAEDSVKSDLLKKIRLAISRRICKNYINADGTISVFEITEKTLNAILPSFEEGEDDFVVKIDSDTAEKLAEKISEKAQKLGINHPKLLVPLECRHLFFTLLSNYLNKITVLSREEIGCNYPIEVIANI